ncbi:MAG: UDP-N-acetylmuramyl-tripeptide synthetase [Candidatus Paceibacterota bacterium]|jgi:UDP-N-acetylmuramoyl-L-alanyl-D-glutamate--2,6-diaminopimelate ligase
MIDSLTQTIRPFIPKKVFLFLQPTYHRLLAFISALIYRFPSRHIRVIAVTGTKGKSSVTEILNAILEEAGHKTTVSNTIRFKIANQSEPNLYKMSMPGRFAIQKFLRKAVNANCDTAIVEMTSQGSLLYRHLWIELDTLIFTNLSPEHIEAHGSYGNYVNSKLALARALSTSAKKDTTLIVNNDDKEASKFLDYSAKQKIKYGVRDAEPYKVNGEGIDFTFDGVNMHSPLSGLINLYNVLAAATTAKSLGVKSDVIQKAVSHFGHIPGRIQKINMGQEYDVVVDYAHTPDSLEKFYAVFHDKRNICVLGGTGGGRDAWKRSEMGRIADEHCDIIILTDEDPYDEDPTTIVNDVAKGITKHIPSIIMDRRLAIHEALKQAKKDDAVLITGKGTDPFIMGPNGTKKPWSDATVTEEEIRKLK